jgi:Ca2+-binding RTX toxin-like protein
VVFGKASGFAANIDLSSLDGTTGFKLSGVAAGDASGRSVASAGDVNGDGFADLIVGAPDADPHGYSSGASYVVFGRLPDTAVSRTGTAASQTLAGGDFNDTLAGLGGDDRLYGNGGNDTLDGGAGDDTLNGGAGTDVMTGGTGNDTYVVDNGGDVVVENAGEGTDTVLSTAHFALAANVETLVLQGSADLQGYGNGDANTLYGNAGGNLLDGRGGADGMLGGAGNDVYFVDNAGDQVFENASEGNDAVFSTAHFGLSANVETLVLQGSADLQGYGNGDANTLYGNAGGNLLDGRGGADAMLGGAGDDTYFVDDAGDVVFENSGEGTDAVFATVNHTLAANVETLVLQGSANLSGTGNTLANNVYGNAGDNTLDGGAGADLLTGNAGNDTFVFHVGEADGDTVVDFAGNGAGAGDSLQFVGYGAGATFTQNDATHWQVNYNGGASHEVITFTNGASIDPTDVLFV